MKLLSAFFVLFISIYSSTSCFADFKQTEFSTPEGTINIDALRSLLSEDFGAPVTDVRISRVFDPFERLVVNTALEERRFVLNFNYNSQYEMLCDLKILKYHYEIEITSCSIKTGAFGRQFTPLYSLMSFQSVMN